MFYSLQHNISVFISEAIFLIDIVAKEMAKYWRNIERLLVCYDIIVIY